MHAVTILSTVIKHRINYTKYNVELNEQYAQNSENTSDCNAECNHLNLNRHRLMKLLLICRNSILDSWKECCLSLRLYNGSVQRFLEGGGDINNDQDGWSGRRVYDQICWWFLQCRTQCGWHHNISSSSFSRKLSCDVPIHVVWSSINSCYGVLSTAMYICHMDNVCNKINQ